nr:N-acetylneuraminate synthase family protein [Chryseobacterium sp. SSA4.19]
MNLVKDISCLEINAVKFHLLFDLEDYIIKNHPAEEVLRKISIPEQSWFQVFDYMKETGKKIVLLCNDLKSLKFVNSIQNQYPIDAVELHSTGLNDIFLLEEAANFKKDIILGVGGSTFDEVKFAVDFLKAQKQNNIVLMHGFQSYPTNYNDINFKRIEMLSNAFGLPIGYADHTDPKDSNNEVISVLPVMNGVKILEKHVTNKFSEQRIDAQAAVSIETMGNIIRLANTLNQSLGSDNLNFSEAELNYGNTGPMKKALVARKPIKKGEIITKEDIAFKRTTASSPLLQKDIYKILGNIALEDIAQDTLLTNMNVEYAFKKQNFDQFFVSDKN